MNLSTSRASGGDHSSPTRGTLLKIQRFEQVYDPDTNKTVVHSVDEAQAQEEKKADPSVDNVFNVWRTVTPNPYNPAAPPRVSVTIDIQSEYLRTTCKKVIGGYMGMSWNVEPLKVCIPLLCRDRDWMKMFWLIFYNIGRSEDFYCLSP